MDFFQKGAEDGREGGVGVKRKRRRRENRQYPSQAGHSISSQNNALDRKKVLCVIGRFINRVAT